MDKNRVKEVVIIKQIKPVGIEVIYVFGECASSCNDIGGVALSFQ